MLIQNIGGAATASRFASDSAPVSIAAPTTQTAPAEQAQSAERVVAEKPTPSQLQSAVESINQAMKQSNANVEFSIDQDTKLTVIRVVESKTGELIRQFPSEEVLAIARAIDQSQQQGLLLKQKA